MACQVGNFKNNYNLIEEPNFWTIEEYKIFIKQVDQKIYKVLFQFLYFTGCRLGEALALNFNDFTDNCIRINKTISKESINGKRIITTPKTKKSIRSIRIDEYLCTKLNSLKEYYIEKYGYFNSNLFIFGYDKPLSPTTIERKKNYYCDKANVRQIRLHDFRHSHATLLLNQKISIMAISKRLGHADCSTTLNVYAHMLPDEEKRVITTLETLNTN